MSGRYGRYVAALGGLILSFSAGQVAGQPTASTPPHIPTRLESDTQRIANALEAANRHNEAPRQQQEASQTLHAAQDAAGWAGWLFGAAIFEAAITAAGVVLVGLTLRAARQSAEEAKRGADEMKRSADAAIKAYELASKEFVSIHRPQLVLRDLTFFGPNESETAKIQFVISNKGEGIGTIAQYEFSLRKRRNNIAPPVAVNQGCRDLSGIEVSPGQREPGQIDSNLGANEFLDEYMAAHEAPMQGRRPYRQTLHVIFEGWINYDDANGLRRRSSFYREYDLVRDRFGPGDDPEREYAD